MKYGHAFLQRLLKRGKISLVPFLAPDEMMTRLKQPVSPTSFCLLKTTGLVPIPHLKPFMGKIYDTEAGRIIERRLGRIN